LHTLGILISPTGTRHPDTIILLLFPTGNYNIFLQFAG
jgi:hypothetical protein